MKKMLLCLIAVQAIPVKAVNFSTKPLFIGSSVDSNLMFILDDSGSMAWEYMPDALEWKYNDRWYWSGTVNKVYFDPNVTYLPPMKGDGSGRYPNVNFNNAPFDGYDSGSSKYDLAVQYKTPRFTFDYNGAFYYEFDTAGCDLSSSSDLNDNSCYVLQWADSLSADGKQNFANWYSYYNTRMKAARAGIGEAFNELPENFRLGWGQINAGSSTIDDASSVRAVQKGVRQYTGTWKESFYDWLYSASPSGGTPLRSALQGAGDYYEKSERAWADNPAIGVGGGNDVRACRQAFTVLMSDGYYNGANPYVGNVDDASGSTISNGKGYEYQYKASDPYQDNVSNSLADVAMYYWKRDLRTDIDNYVPTSENNPAFWQHMSTYTIGLGVEGSIDPDDAWKAVDEEAAVSWWSGSTAENRVNDMLHAAVNGHGGFFSSKDPQSFAKKLKGTIGEIVNQASSATNVEFDAAKLEAGTLAFAAQFDPNGWTGDLKAVVIEGDPPIIPAFTGESFEKLVDQNKAWSAQEIMDAQDNTWATSSRLVITYSGGEGTAFNVSNYSSLDATQKADLEYGGDADLGKQRLDYLRGDTSLDGTAGFRKRGSRMGSLVNSSPSFVGAPASNWPNLSIFGDGNYSAFESNSASRTPVIYVGANDGMLHGFKATDPNNSGGEELLAYIPNFVSSSSSADGLHYLSDPTYEHRYYIDLDVGQQDIYMRHRKANGDITSGEAWRTVVIGGGRSGAKGIFALDVTDPSQFSEANAATLALWEFTEKDDARLGHLLEAPTVALAKWGGSDIRWTVFVSNGYNSDNKSTGFFMLDVEGGLDDEWTEGDDYRYIELNSGGSGLSPLVEIDSDGDFIVDRVYAGDLSGDLWVAADSGGGSWAKAYGQPLFKAGKPITGAPTVAANNFVDTDSSNVPNFMVYFGTGKYLESSDVSTTGAQRLYGVWDKGDTEITESNLAERTVSLKTVNDGNGGSLAARVMTGDPVDFAGGEKGWYIPLPSTGERIVYQPQVYHYGYGYSEWGSTVILFNSLVPDQDPCLGGGTGWLMAVGLDGLTPETPFFLNYPDPISGFATPGIPGGEVETIDGSDDTSFIPPPPCFNCGGNPPPPIPVPPWSSTGVGQRGWQEIIQR